VGTQDKAASPEIVDKVLSVILVGTKIMLQSSRIVERNHDSTSDNLAAL